MLNLKSTYNNWFVESNRAERIWMMAVMDFKLRYYENKLGLIWALIKPLSQLVVYYLVFEVILSSGVENYALYLFSGLIIWNFFTESTTGTIKILQTKRYLYEYTNMKKLEIYTSALISNSIGFLFNLVVYLIAAAIVGIYPYWTNFWFLLVFLNTAILAYGVSLILSNLFLHFKDISQIWGIVVQFGFFLSPILIRGDLFTSKLPALNYLNPMAGVIINTRNTLMEYQNPDWFFMLWCFLYSIVLLFLGLLVFRKYSPRASEILS